MDFAVQYLLPSVGITVNDRDATSYDGQGGFFVFGSDPTAYNAFDGGNFLWGQGMQRLGFDYSSAQFGSQANEYFTDTATDQRAIQNGFNYNVTTSKSYPGEYLSGLPISNFSEGRQRGNRGR
jgi:hypothetical protein